MKTGSSLRSDHHELFAASALPCFADAVPFFVVAALVALIPGGSAPCVPTITTSNTGGPN